VRDSGPGSAGEEELSVVEKSVLVGHSAQQMFDLVDAVEAYPPRPGTGKHAHLPLHEHCLFKLGIHLGEIWYLTELANWLRARGRNRFLLTAPPLRLPGAVGSPATPVATV